MDERFARTAGSFDFCGTVTEIVATAGDTMVRVARMNRARSNDPGRRAAKTRARWVPLPGYGADEARWIASDPYG